MAFLHAYMQAEALQLWLCICCPRIGPGTARLQAAPRNPLHSPLPSHSISVSRPFFLPFVSLFPFIFWFTFCPPSSTLRPPFVHPSSTLRPLFSRLLSFCPHTGCQLVTLQGRSPTAPRARFYLGRLGASASTGRTRIFSQIHTWRAHSIYKFLFCLTCRRRAEACGSCSLRRRSCLGSRLRSPQRDLRLRQQRSAAPKRRRRKR